MTSSQHRGEARIGKVNSAVKRLGGKAQLSTTTSGSTRNEDGTITHAEARIGDSIVGAFDTREGWPETPCFLRLYVEDADTVYQQALAAGAVSVTEMTSLVWGDRGGRVRDPLGNIWWIQTHVENVDQEEMAKRAAEKPSLDAIRYTRESLDREMRSRGRE